MAAESYMNAEFEKLIAETRDAEEFGVFAATRVDVSALIEAPRPSLVVRIYERTVVALPLAACLAIAIGIATWGKSSSQAPALVFDSQPEVKVAGDLCGPEMFAQCVSGPGQPVIPGCGCADLDADGDVDISDFSSYQVMASISP